MAIHESGHPVRGEPGLVQRVRSGLGDSPAEPPWRIAIGLSGGTDSLALAAVLSQLAHRGEVDATAVHVDHGLREGSAAEQQLVGRHAAALGLRFHGVRLDKNLRTLHSGLGWEEAARRERFRALATVAAEEGATIIAIGHHASDQAETVLLHIARGAGLHGAGGMRQWSERAIPWWTETAAPTRYWIWRPFLNESKATLVTFVRELALEPIEDPSNRSSDFRRNRVRNEILPRLEEIAPGATDALGRFASLAAADNDFLAHIAAETLERVQNDDGSLARDSLVTEHRVIQGRVARLWLLEQRSSDLELSLNRIEAVLRLAAGRNGGTRIQIGSGWSVSLVGGRLTCVEDRRSPDREERCASTV